MARRPDPRKLKEEALEAAAKGRWKKALEAYEQLEKLEPREGTWPQKAGDMNRRLGDKAAAIACLGRAAEVFSSTGFLLKAIACCKVILDLDPNHTETQSRLASFHAQRGAHAAAPTGAIAALVGGTVNLPSPSPSPSATPAPRPPPAATPAATPAALPPTSPRPQPPPAVVIAAPPRVTTPPPAQAAPTPTPAAPTPPPAPRPPPPAPAPAAPAASPPPPAPVELIDLEVATEVSVEEAALETEDLHALALEAAATLAEPTPSAPDVRRSGPPPRARSLPPGIVTLDQVPLGRVVPGARRSAEISVVSDAGAYEIPLDDSLDAAFEAVTTSGGTASVVEPAHAETARSLFPRTPIFSSLDERRLRALIERVKLRQLDAGEVLFRQGDPGDALYVIAEGEVAVQGGEPQAPVELARLGEGAFFGEIALVARQPRTATVAATQPTELLVIDGETLFDLIEDQPEVLKVILRFLRDRLVERLMETSELFAPFTAEERRTLVARFRFIEADSGAVLVQKGKRAPGLFVLLSGQARLVADGPADHDLAAGEIFGETSLLAHAPADWAVTTGSRCYLLELPRSEVQEIIMTHPQVLEYLSRISEGRQRRLSMT